MTPTSVDDYHDTWSFVRNAFLLDQNFFSGIRRVADGDPGDYASPFNQASLDPAQPFAIDIRVQIPIEIGALFARVGV